MADDLAERITAFIESNECVIPYDGLALLHEDLIERVRALLPRCDQCRWWTRRNAIDDDCWQVGEPQGTPEWIAEYERIGRCAKAETSGGNAKDVVSLARAVDYEKYHAELMTSPDFGCVQFEQKA